MSLFEDQLKIREEKDDDSYARALDDLAQAVENRRQPRFTDRQRLLSDAVDEILRYYRLPVQEQPADTADVQTQIEQRLHSKGIMSRHVILDKGWYRHSVGPLLGTRTDDGSAVALLPGWFSGYSYYDRKTKKRVHLNRRTEAGIASDAICFYSPLPMRKLTAADLFLFMLRQLSVSDILFFVGAAALAALLGLVTPLINVYLFGDVLHQKDASILVTLAIFMICYSLSRALIAGFRALLSARIGIKQEIAVKAAVMHRVFSLPASFFKQFASGNLSQRAEYVQSTCSLLFQTAATTGFTCLFSLIYFSQIFSFGPSMAWTAVLISGLTLLITLVSTFMQMRISRETLKCHAKTSGLSYAQIRGIQKIRLAGAEKRMFTRWADTYSKEAKLKYSPPLFLKLSQTLCLAVELIGTLLLYYFAVKSSISVPYFNAFNAAFAMVSGAFASVVSIASSIAQIRPSLEMAAPLLEAEPESSEGKIPVTDLRGGIELSHVSFRYAPDLPDVIDDLSLHVRPGEYLAVVGSTGCGKSTLLRLLLGFETPQKGSIFYDRMDLAALDKKTLRRKIGVVLQNSKLFLGDIFSNITISSPALTVDEAWQAAEIASVADDIRAMPMGMYTLISEGQGGISGGQRQRLMIARAVANKPKILMFDEATSALDNVTQKKVSEAIDALHCTRIVIAHRLSTIRHCDRIIMLEGGKIIEDGTYEELLAKKGAFAELVERQQIEPTT